MVDTEIAHGFAEHGVWHPLQQGLLLRAQVQRVNMAQYGRRAGVFQLGGREPLGHAAKGHGQPVAVEILMRQVVAVLLFELGHPLSHQRVGTGIGRVGGKQFVGKGQRRINATHNPLAWCAQRVGVFGEQIAHGHHGRPARLGVVAHVNGPTHFGPAAYQAGDVGTVFVRYPAPDAVQANAVKFGQIRAVAKVGKGLIHQMRRCARGLRKGLRKTRLRRVEICAVPGAGTGCSVHIHAHPLAKTQLTVHALSGWHQARVQKRQAGIHRVQFGVITKGVANVGHVAGSPI